MKSRTNPTTPRPELVFVYGTLKRGFHNHHWLEASEAEFVSEGTTREAYPLLISRVPYLLPLGGRGHRVSGELYRVSPLGISFLDLLESHPDWYKRNKVIIVDSRGRHRYAWTYFLSSSNIPSNWESKQLHSKFTY